MRNCRTRTSDPHASNPSESSVPESSPVAEANSSAFLHFAGVLLLMPGTLREIQTSCPACHFAFRTMQKVFPALDGFSFIPPDRPECKGMFTKLVRLGRAGLPAIDNQSSARDQSGWYFESRLSNAGRVPPEHRSCTGSRRDSQARLKCW